MGIFDSMRRRSSSIKDSATIKSTKTDTSSGYSSRYSSAPTSRCTSPFSRTRSTELSSIISRSIKYPNSPPLSAIQSPIPNLEHSPMDLAVAINRGAKENVNKDRDDGRHKDGNAPEGFRSFLESAKKTNPTYNKRQKLDIMKPISKDDSFGWFMERKRDNTKYEEI